ncbi:PREDICTED: PI-PLC X domain-containing protein 1-like [Myotis brandtii]|uniref:PI-PLC X domain-containing protein 1-like n=1 Tax=Myotis brandtii TaxID=109478 RepID=UPI000703F111|nr:PREDICTED: PI-PLC X domain-containing protein 1-like [Myotis brandtii]
MSGQVSASGAFRSLPCRANPNADWMSGLSPRLWDVPLHHLSIPGSHDTMTYSLSKRSPVSRSESRLLQLLAKFLPCILQPVVLKWSVTQVRASVRPSIRLFICPSVRPSIQGGWFPRLPTRLTPYSPGKNS